MDGVEIRRATAEDRLSVIGIHGGVYEGLDYLEDYYNDVFINDPNTTSYVAVYKGDIVAFVAALLVDGGDTVVTRAGRVKPGFSGRGFYKQLSHYAIRSSGANVNAFTSVNTNAPIHTESFKKENAFVLSRSMTRYDLNTQQLHLRFADDIPTDTLAHLTGPLLEQIITSAAHNQYLFPNGRFVANWVPYQLLRSNIPLILKEDSRTLKVTDVRYEDDNMKGLLTMSKIYTAANGVPVCILDIYGSDGNSLRRHLETQLNFLCGQSSGDTVILVLSDSGLETAALEASILQLTGLAQTVWISQDDSSAIFNAQFLYEKNVKENKERLQ